MKYIDYRHKVEFSDLEYKKIDLHVKELELFWFASCWDVGAVQDMEKFDFPI